MTIIKKAKASCTKQEASYKNTLLIFKLKQCFSIIRA